MNPFDFKNEKDAGSAFVFYLAHIGIMMALCLFIERAGFFVTLQLAIQGVYAGILGALLAQNRINKDLGFLVAIISAVLSAYAGIFLGFLPLAWLSIQKTKAQTPNP